MSFQPRDINSTAASALQFLILTAARSNEVIGAQWDEINIEQRLWTVPGPRMKGGVEHAALEQRRRLMEAWAQFCTAREDNVIPIEGWGPPRQVAAPSFFGFNANQGRHGNE
jgi:integrase